jgi:crotonobetainyl-CoA:carnitine CoA-transferase CaiB-like acyl-CoA transferase
VEKEKHMAGALDGIRVIDFGQYIAGPLTAMLLADQGADVVRVDPPGGPRWDVPGNATWNRGKRSVVLDLKEARDVESARRLIAGADVVVENFRSGVMARLGLGSEAMTAMNPRLVYCSIPGFAPDDPRAGVAGWEGVVAAATATYREQPGSAHPVYTAIPIASTYAAFQAAVSITMALNAREVDGRGQTVLLPLFDAMFAAVGNRGLTVHNRQGQPPMRAAGMLGWTRQFECKDGRWIQFHGGNKNLRDFLQATGAAEWAGEPDLPQRAEAFFKTKTAQEWEDLSEQVGTECAVARTTAEWMDTVQARESQIVVEIDDPRLGRMRQAGINVRMSGTPGSIRGPAPTAAAHQRQVLSSLDGASPPAQAASAAELRAALEGVRVLDLCIVLAGPTCGRTLAEFGADVVKIDSPSREAVSFHNDINRAKRSILLDLKKQEGLDIFWRLVDTADVVAQNFRKGVAERLGIGYEAVQARKPDIVYASLNTYGQIGPWAGRPGHEQIAQAATGMQDRYGGRRPVLQPFAVNDYGTGFMGAYGVALALLHRKRTGQGQHVDTALAYTATMLQSPFLNDYDGKEWDEPRGQDALGSGPLHRAYQARDAWLFLGAKEADVRGIERALEVSGLDDLSAADLEACLEGRIRESSCSDAVNRLREAGIGAHEIVNDVGQLMNDPWVREHGLSITREHDEFGPITTTGPTPRLSRTPVEPGRPAPKPGSDALSILQEVGMGDQLSALVERGVIRLEGVLAR